MQDAQVAKSLYLARVYCEDTGYGENNSVQRCVSLSFYAHKLILIAITYDAVALFLKYKHVDGCSFFELMLQYVPVNTFFTLIGTFFCLPELNQYQTATEPLLRFEREREMDR